MFVSQHEILFARFGPSYFSCFIVYCTAAREVMVHSAVLLAFYSPMLDSCDIQMFTLFIEARWWERISLDI